MEFLWNFLIISLFAGPVAHGRVRPRIATFIHSTAPLYSPPPGALGAQEASRVPRAELRSFLVRLGLSWVWFWAVCGHFVAIVESSCGYVGSVLGRLGSLRNVFGRLGAVLGLSRGHFGPSSGHSGPSWGCLVPS